jgi:hypothetical protein
VREEALEGLQAERDGEPEEGEQREGELFPPFAPVEHGGQAEEERDDSDIEGSLVEVGRVIGERDRAWTSPPVGEDERPQRGQGPHRAAALVRLEAGGVGDEESRGKQRERGHG